MYSNAFAVLMLCVIPFSAQATVYDCKVDKGSANLGWITDRYQFEYIPESGTINIADGVIYAFNDEKPVEGFVSAASDVKINFRWSVLVMDDLQQRFKLNFRGVLYLANSEFSVQANPVGYNNKFHARGTCQIVR